MPKISELTEATSLTASDEIPVVQASTTKRVGVDTLRSDIRAEARWNLVATSKYTATPASTSRITMSDTTDMVVGLPLKYTYNSVTYYGIVAAISAGTYIDIAGAPLDVAHNLTALRIGQPEMVAQVPFFVSGTYGNGLADLLLADMNAYQRWKLPAARLVQFEATHATADTGASQPKVNVKVGGNAVGTQDSNNGLQLGAAGTWVACSAVSINTTNYVVSYGSALEVSCTAAGSNGDASDLSGNMIFVLE